MFQSCRRSSILLLDVKDPGATLWRRRKIPEAAGIYLRPAAFFNEATKGLPALLLSEIIHPEIIHPEIKPMVVAAHADDPEETEVSVPEISKGEEHSVKVMSPDEDSKTTILCGDTDARLTVGSLEAMGRGYPWSSEQSEQERETRENRDESYFETCRYHGASHFLL